uniref:Cdpk1 n=1 Tax=Arundo donax TaxID=35708 RepID=A0A0A9E3M3_ARUDO
MGPRRRGHWTRLLASGRTSGPSTSWERRWEGATSGIPAPPS